MRLAALLAVSLSACAGVGGETVCLGASEDVEALRADLRARHLAEFACADLFKPAMDVADFDPYQAPLVYVECAPPGDPPRDDALSARSSSPTVYYREDPGSGDGERPRRLVVAWFVPASGGPELQALRTTFDRLGRPALVEVMGDRTGRSVVYAAKSLEAAAVARLGEPEPWAFALSERLHPSAVLVGTFEDGPMAMGPYVYHGAGAADVWTLHCRCEPTRAREIRELVEYELRPLEELDAALSFPSPEHLDGALRLADAP